MSKTPSKYYLLVQIVDYREEIRAIKCSYISKTILSSHGQVIQTKICISNRKMKGFM